MDLPTGSAHEVVQVDAGLVGAVVLGDTVLHSVFLVDPRSKLQATRLHVERERVAAIILEIWFATAFGMDRDQIDKIPVVMENS